MKNKNKQFPHCSDSSHISYDELLRLTDYGIFAMNIKGNCIRDDRLKECKPIKSAIYNGIYVGSPGRDIYFMLPYLDEEQQIEIVRRINKKFPKKPPQNHFNIASLVRLIYGQFERNGILRSDADFSRMKNEDLNWELSRKFLAKLAYKFDADKNYYGLSILYEMEGHRSGDEAVINNDRIKLCEMEQYYNKSVDMAYMCKSYKQLFTPYYWCSRYFMKMGTKDKALKYSKLTIKNADKYCPDSRQSYIDKLLYCVRYVKMEDDKNWESFYSRYRKSKNNCVKKTFKSIKK